MSTAPQNNKLLNNGEKEYDGVGPMLIAKAAEESVKAGYGGHLHGIANTSKTLKYYTEKWGAKPIPSNSMYGFEINEKSALELIKKYGLKKGE